MVVLPAFRSLIGDGGHPGTSAQLHLPASASSPHAMGGPASAAAAVEIHGDPIANTPHMPSLVQQPFAVRPIAAGRSGHFGSATAGGAQSTCSIVFWTPQVLVASSKQHARKRPPPLHIDVPHAS